MKAQISTVQCDVAVSLPQLRTTGITRRDVRAYFENTWGLTETLFSGVSEEALFRPPYHQLRHPLIFYFGHPAVLYVNKLRVAGVLDGPVNAHFEEIFEVGVDEMSWDDMSKNEMTWPSLEAVIEYRRSVHDLIVELIKTHPALDPADGLLPERPGWALVMGFEHERIHLETSSVLIRELPLKLVTRPPEWPPSIQGAGSTPANGWLAIEPRTVTFGKPVDHPTFGWDNEYGVRCEQVAAFEATRYLVSNREFFEFVVDAGYRDPAFWTETGWKWRQFRNSKWPTFWVPDGPQGLNRFKLRTIFELIDFEPSWPAVVNFHEAQAYCAWKAGTDGAPGAYGLLTEGEQLSLREQAGSGQGWNFELVQGSEGPVDAWVSEAGVGDVFGNVWQWSQDTFNPLLGFRPHRYYEDFSSPCFDGEHQMIFGGSFISTGDEASEWARFHFRPHFFQHAGFRMRRAVTR
jgi:5-histidylcysteine sulfoxide synthase